MKIWRKIDTLSDQKIFQQDIENLLNWSINNKIKFHPSKCKLLRSTLKRNPIITNYNLGTLQLEAPDNERDLGVIMHPKLLYNKHHLAVLAKASQKLGLIKRIVP